MAYTYGTVTKCKVANGQTRDEYECRLGYQVNSQNIEKNTSNITLRLEVRSISSSYKTYGYNQTSTIDGTKLSAESFDMRDTNTWQIFGSRTITINHDADGSYSVSKSGSFTTTASSGYSLKSGSASVTVKPDTIPRASQPTVSASSVAMGSSLTITTNKVSDSFTHTIMYSFGNASGTIASSVTTSTTWTPPLSLANQVPNGIKGTCTITCQTYNGSTLIGTKTVQLELTIPDTVKPSINSITISEASTTVPSSWGVYVQGKSTLKVVTTASGSYGSSITGYKITGIDSVTYNSASFTSSTLQTAGTRTITVTVTDSRGRTETKTTTYTCVAYNNPSISVANVTRCNSDGTENEEGTYIKYNFTANVAPVSNKNTYEYKIGYKKSTDSYYTYITISNNAYTLNKNNVVITSPTFSEDYSYDFQFLVSDYFTSATNVQSIATGFTLMDFNTNGKAMAIGKASEAEGDEELLEIALPTEFQNGLKGNLEGNATSATNSTLWNGLTDEHATESTTDTWVLVYNDGKIKHRVIPAGTPAIEKAKSIVASEADTQSYIILGSLLICWGNVVITPTANIPTSKSVTFSKTYASKPVVTISPYSTVPGTTVLGAGASGVTTTGFDAYVTRTSTTNTSLLWIAIGQVS